MKKFEELVSYIKRCEKEETSKVNSIRKELEKDNNNNRLKGKFDYRCGRLFSYRLTLRFIEKLENGDCVFMVDEDKNL